MRILNFFKKRTERLEREELKREKENVQRFSSLGLRIGSNLTIDMLALVTEENAAIAGIVHDLIVTEVDELIVDDFTWYIFHLKDSEISININIPKILFVMDDAHGETQECKFFYQKEEYIPSDQKSIDKYLSAEYNGIIGRDTFEADGTIYDRCWADDEGWLDPPQFEGTHFSKENKQVVHYKCNLYGAWLNEFENLAQYIFCAAVCVSATKVITYVGVDVTPSIITINY